MKREEIKALLDNAEMSVEEKLKSIMDINGADVEKAKGNLTEIKTELENNKNAFNDLSTQFEELKTKNASAEEWQKKFDELTAKVEADNEKAEAERLAKEKADGIAGRFTTVLGEKKFNHDAIKNDYLRKFGEALDNKDFEGKSDAEIFHELTKDDASAFVGVTTVNLAGSNISGTGKKYNSKEEIDAIKDITERQKAIAENLDLYQ